MSQSARFTGRPVSEGMASGRLHQADPGPPADATAEQVREAFAAVAADRGELAERLRGAGRAAEADIIGVAGLIAADPALVGPAVTAVVGGTDAATAVTEAAEAQATMLAGLAVPELAERAADVRQVGRAVLDRLATAGAPPPPAGDFILVRREVSPADLIEFAERGLAGAVSIAGGGSSHAAIIARGLGLPMITGVDATVLALPGGEHAVLDGTTGELRIGPETGPGPAPGPAMSGNGQHQAWPPGPVATADGRVITVLCNVASAAETRRGLAAGATGVGLLRTEIPFTGALAWPTLDEHRAHLAPILGLLTGRTATARLLDFSGDKIPPFLAGAASPAFGLAALLAHPSALRDQLRAILEAGRDARLAVLIPMVSSLDEVAQVRAALAETAVSLDAPVPRLGIMVELAATARAAETFAPAVDFFSIGTNDLAGQVLGLDRRDPSARPALAADPRVLALIAHTAQAAREARLTVSVCGDAAADPQVLPLLVGLGVDTLSVPAARVPRVRSWVADLDARACADLAEQALAAPDVEAVWKLVPAL